MTSEGPFNIGQRCAQSINSNRFKNLHFFLLYLFDIFTQVLVTMVMHRHEVCGEPNLTKKGT